MEIGFSEFCNLSPKWCVNVGASGSHTVCVCRHHQNAILLVNALCAPCTYKDLMKMIVCDVQRNECMSHHCSDCPGTKLFRDFEVMFKGMNACHITVQNALEQS